MLTFLNSLYKRKKAMYKLDPILRDFNLDISKTSKNYLEMKAMLMEFEREYNLKK